MNGSLLSSRTAAPNWPAKRAKICCAQPMAAACCMTARPGCRARAISCGGEDDSFRLALDAAVAAAAVACHASAAAGATAGCGAVPAVCRHGRRRLRLPKPHGLSRPRKLLFALIWLLLILAAVRPQWLGDPLPVPSTGTPSAAGSRCLRLHVHAGHGRECQPPAGGAKGRGRFHPPPPRRPSRSDPVRHPAVFAGAAHHRSEHGGHSS